MTLVSLVYISSADPDVNADTLLDILEVSRRKNLENGITGMLLFQNGFFIQALEGEEAAVESTYSSIQRDDRHRHLIVVEKIPIERRSFANWSMGFKNLDQLDTTEVEGLTEFLQNPMTNDIMRDNPSHAVRLLERFKTEYGW